MVPIKVQCECGQRYAFEIEPVHGRMPSPVSCPSCGADGTAAANAIIAQSQQTQPMPAPAATVPLRAAVATPPNPPAVSIAPSRPAPAPRRPAMPLLGQVDRTQAKHEARAKISWGDSPREVVGYLMGQGFSVEDASNIVQELVRERTSTIRGRGMVNIISGILLICVPIAALFIFLSLGYIMVRTFVVTIAVGFGGVWLLIKGIGMVVSPKSEEGDAAGNN